MIEKYNKLLQRQLRKYYAGKEIPQELGKLLSAINNSYEYYERDRELIERAIDLSSRELLEANEKALAESKKQKIAQQKLRENELILKSINQNVNEAIYRSSPNSGLIFVNSAFVELFGYDSIQEVLQVPVINFYVHPAHRADIYTQFEKNPIIKNREILYKKKDGSTFWGLVNTILVKDEQGNVYYDGSIVDITQQKITEKKLLKTNKQLKKINTELDQFVYSASHDLKAPLKSLLGLINVIDIELDKQADIKPYLSMMERSVRKLDNFITDLIHYSRNARTEKKTEIIDFQDIITEVIDKIQYLPQSKNIHTKINIKAEGHFNSDKYRLILLFNNLITNAFKYHDLKKNQPFVSIQVNYDPAEAEIIIQDNGQGIDEEHIPRLFDMFYRASLESSGSGLGLYIVKEVLHKLKGKINVESKVGEGTKFMLYIPNQLAS